MKKIPLSKGQFAIVDDDDFKYLNRFKWRAVDNKTGGFNVSTSISIGSNKIVALPMWVFLLEQKTRLKIHYKNRNPLDHRKSNLQLVTPSEFCISQPKMFRAKNPPTSIYKGVSFRKSQPLWSRYEAVIQKQGVVYRKRFSDEKEASRWYDEMAQKLYGDIAYKNNV